jgi:hypothetical protein
MLFEGTMSSDKREKIIASCREFQALECHCWTSVGTDPLIIKFACFRVRMTNQNKKVQEILALETGQIYYKTESAMFSSFLRPQKRQRGNELIVSIYLLDLAWFQDETDIT